MRTTGKQCGLAATGVYQPSLRSPWLAAFEALNRDNLTDAEFARLLEGIISPDTFACAETLRHRNTFEREDGTPLHYQLVNLKDWCKNSFEVVNQLRINTKSSFQRYDVILLLNGLPLV
ncbi:type I restriction endonuclease, partial [Thiolapillus sp.]|uniref:type I restriction endonuclease n=1 Tax=Thiolapillus sp. TaxID=2017437 RepID=UPI003AF95CAF